MALWSGRSRSLLEAVPGSRFAVRLVSTEQELREASPKRDFLQFLQSIRREHVDARTR
jgi:hypothetical protein